MSYVATLKEKARQNMDILTQRCIARGITNPFAQAAILAIVGKESGFLPKLEQSYSTTSNARIRSIFGSRLAKYTDAALTNLKQDEKKFFEAVYGYTTSVGKSNGNTQPGDGYKYRGRGFNQITFKATYEKIGKQIGVDLVSYPELANGPSVAADIAIQYFINAFAGSKTKVQQLYNSSGPNDFKNLNDSLNAYYHANAGFGHSVAKIKADPTGGLKQAEKTAPDLLTFVSSNKKKVVASGGILLLSSMALAALAINSNKNKKVK